MPDEFFSVRKGQNCAAKLCIVEHVVEYHRPTRDADAGDQSHHQAQILTKAFSPVNFHIRKRFFELCLPFFSQPDSASCRLHNLPDRSGIGHDIFAERIYLAFQRFLHLGEFGLRFLTGLTSLGAQLFDTRVKVLCHGSTPLLSSWEAG
jgi:hypothetical protein